MTVEPFRIDVPQDVLDDLHDRLARTRRSEACALNAGPRYHGAPFCCSGGTRTARRRSACLLPSFAVRNMLQTEELRLRVYS
jgi:hypothetical protein